MLAEAALRNADTLEDTRPYLRRISQLAEDDPADQDKPNAIGFRLEPVDEPSEDDE